MPPGKSKDAKTVATRAKAPAVKANAIEKPAVVPAAEVDSLHERKTAIRREMREGLLKMRGRADRSARICDAIVAHASWRRATIVAIFAPMETEPDIEKLWKHAEGRTICYPIIRMGTLDFIRVTDPESVSAGQFGIREPVFDQARVIPPGSFDLVLVPGVAFTADGERLGRGGGFYDRLLSSPGFRAFKVGVCFDRQVRETLPVEPHDQRVHRVVTEKGILQRPDLLKQGKPAA